MQPEYVNFNFSLVSNYEARVQLTANDSKTNYSVTNETYPRIVQEFEARFSQLGFKTPGPNEPFYWSMKNIFNGEEIISTKNRKFII